jgi:ubiquinone/menaquinone biosynthesis C-methylase UbiE
MSWWDRKVLPFLVEKACRSTQILAERTRWIPEARGEVLEVGLGSGLNVPFYDAARVASVIGIDVSAELLAKAAPRAQRAAIPVELATGDAEALAFDRGRFDSVVATYTLCSVRSVPRVLAEIRRVLAPDGRLILIEHGASPDPQTARWQRRITPLWKRVGGNCHLDRDMRGELARAGFALDEVISGDDDAPRWMSYTTRGIARV